MERTQPVQRRFRFPLSTLLVVVTVFCASLGTTARRAELQRKAIAGLTQGGARIRFDYEPREYARLRKAGGKRFTRPTPPGPLWLRKLVGDEYFRRVVRVSGGMNDGDMAFLAGCADLQSLRTGGRLITDEGLQYVSRLRHLTQLIVNNSAITDEGLRHISHLTQLKEVVLDGASITDAGLVHLQWLTNLDSLSLRSCEICGPGIKHLKRLQNLRRLSLQHNPVNDEGIVEIVQLTSLESLSLGDQVTDAGLAHLNCLPNLKQLSLEGPRITDEGLRYLAKLNTLQELYCWNTSATQASEALLTKALPNCRCSIWSDSNPPWAPTAFKPAAGPSQPATSP